MREVLGDALAKSDEVERSISLMQCVGSRSLASTYVLCLPLLSDPNFGLKEQGEREERTLGTLVDYQTEELGTM